MKPFKPLKIILVLCMLFSIFLPITAADMDILVKSDGNLIALDQAPFFKNYRVMVPAVQFLKGLGAEVTITDDKLITTKNGKTVELYWNRGEAVVNGVAAWTDAAPYKQGELAVIPAAVTARGLGYNVTFNDITYILHVDSPGYVSPSGGTLTPSGTTPTATPAPGGTAATPPPFTPTGPERFETVACTGDAFVRGGDTENENKGTDKRLEFKATSDAGYARRIYLQFDVSKITDPLVTNAKVRFYTVNLEKADGKATVVAYATDSNWKETEITFKNAPAKGDQIGQAVVDKNSAWFELDISDYVRAKLSAGEKTISVCLDGIVKENFRLDFDSREAANKPELKLKYGGTFDVVEAVPTVAPIVLAVDPVENAKAMMLSSKATVTKETPSNEPVMLESGDMVLYPSEDTYARGGSNAKQNFAGDSVIGIKGAPDDDPDMKRKAYLKFNLSAAPESSYQNAVLRLYCTTLQDNKTQTVSALKMDDNWNEKDITWEKQPAAGAKIADAAITKVGQWVEMDITSYVNEQLKGDKTVSLSLQDVSNQNLRLEFSSSAGTNKPELLLSKAGYTIALEKDDGYQYVMVDVNSNPSNKSSKYNPTKTRVLSSLPGFKAGQNKISLSKYGGRTDKKQKATGFFYTKKIGARWYMVDPDGYEYINIGMVAVSPYGTPNEKKAMEAKFGNETNWANTVTKDLIGLGFNGAGAWSKDELLQKSTTKYPYTSLFYFVTGYGDSIGTTEQQSGHKGFEGDAIPVFDPDFVTFADELAKKSCTPLKDDPYFMGYFTDNELPCSSKMLDQYLQLDNTNPQLIYSYTTAWEWLKARHGANASLSDVTANDREDWREFVYDRYFSVVSAAIKKYDPNHMILGCRYYSEARTSPGMHRAAGRYCDAVSMNYYSHWSPDLNNMAQWEEWSGKPCLITEWYVKGADSGMGNTSGAGWLVKTQKDRGLFYQNFTIGLLESKSCVGWHWFKYRDNDPTSPASDPSNTDSNKGIISGKYEYYKDLTSQMKAMNQEVYNIADYFDTK